jgi:signal transduction histidine kinase
VPGGVKLSVANTGEGIQPADLPFIFERFYRGDKSRSREQGGAGIGLAIVKELVEAHGGHVGAASSPTETQVWFTLPARSPVS